MNFINTVSPDLLQRRERPREEDERGVFFRDTTAIIHSYPFRRLKHKTQVFFSPKNDHICTRIEHVMHVATISATLCRGLGLDADLAWAISLGHDLGHTPFGHVGEKILSSLISRGRGFVHELYSLRVVDHLIHYGKGLNLSYAVRDGIVTHCGELFEQRMTPDFTIKDLSAITSKAEDPATWEGAVVRMSDKIAYLGRDLEDAVQLGLISPEEVPERPARVLGNDNSTIIDTLVKDVIRVSPEQGAIAFSDDVFQAVLELKEFNYSKIYASPILANYHVYFERILGNLYRYLEDLFGRYGMDPEKYRLEHNLLAHRFGDYCKKMQNFYDTSSEDRENVVVDYVAGMTDDYAIDSVKEIMIPKQFEYQFEEFLLGNKEPGNSKTRNRI